MQSQIAQLKELLGNAVHRHFDGAQSSHINWNSLTCKGYLGPALAWVWVYILYSRESDDG
jgi:hypothetical protein